MQFPLANTKGLFSNILAIHFPRQFLHGFEASYFRNPIFNTNLNCHSCLGLILAMAL